jgi:hypothetical protein
MMMHFGVGSRSGAGCLFTFLLMLISRSMPIAVVFTVVRMTQKGGGEESYNIVVGAPYRHCLVRMYRSCAYGECERLE